MSLSGQPQAKALETLKARLKRKLQDEVRASGIAQKAIAIEIGMDEGQFSRSINDRYPEQFPAWALLGWTREVGPGLLEWLAQQTGRDLVAAEPDEDVVVPDLLPAIAEHSGALIAHLVKARLSSAVGPPERDEIRAQIQKLIHELQLEAEYFDSPAERLRRPA